jgi:hypothetical protein
LYYKKRNALSHQWQGRQILFIKLN